MGHKKTITSTVLLLSLVSLFTDMSSEMLYPVLPLYLEHIGFSVIAIGLLEGVAEAIAGLSKGYFGTWSDNLGKRLPFVRFGYLLSAVSKPMMALFPSVAAVFSARSADRIGKGIRTGARDAMLAAEATPQTIGAVFGFHRAMDTLGAVFGPAIAMVFLMFFPGNYHDIFLWAFIPGMVAIIITFVLKEKTNTTPAPKQYPSFRSFYTYWRNAPTAYKKIASALLVFALFNSSDIFLLLKLREAGMDDAILIANYIIYNAAFALCAYPAGMLADKYGFKKVLIAGLLCFIVVYAICAVTTNFLVITFLFICYGFYAAATESVARAWLLKNVASENRAAAIGTFTGFQSISLLVASSVAGLCWYNFGSTVALLAPAAVTLLVVLYLHFKTT